VNDGGKRVPPAPPSSPAPPDGSTRFGAVIEAQLDRLLPIFAADAVTAAQFRRLYRLFTADSLDRPATLPFDGLSFINASGLPFQWVFNLSPAGHGLGFLCEVGHPGTPAAMRLAETLDRVKAACRLADGTNPGFLRQAAAILLPAGAEPWPDHWRSAAWVGVVSRGRTVALKPYFNLNRGSCRDRWLRVGWLLKALRRERALAKLCELSPCCSAGSWPVGLALDILPDGCVGRVKFYFRSEPTTLEWLARWHEAAGVAAAAPEVRRFLDLIGPTNRSMLPAGALVVSLEVHADERLTLKADLAVTKWAMEDGPLFEAAMAFLSPWSSAAQTLARSLRAVGLVPDSRTESALLRFVGLGLEPDGGSHLNLYLERPLAPSPVPARPVRPCRPTAVFAGAVRQGVTALLDALADDHWEDFALPVGPSDVWVTAYILAMLADLPPDLRDWLRPALAPVLAWLVTHRRSGGGWGYNRTVPDDADSTAWSIIALRAWDCAVPSAAVEFLGSCCQGEGFATYPAWTSPARAWAAAAPDVGAVVARALGLPGPVVASAEQEELAPAYWWASPLYTTAMRLDSAAGEVPARLRQQLVRFTPSGPFERALLVRAAIRAGLSPYRQAARLLRTQRRDGLWPGAARLRLARDSPDPPWHRINSGPLYTDIRGLFTTATAVAALAMVMAERRSGGAGTPLGAFARVA